MKTIDNLITKIAKPYAVIYVVVLHILAVCIIADGQLDFTQSTPDIILGYIGVIATLLICNICFLIPSLGIIAFGTLVSFFMSISMPLFLFFALFQACGANSVNVLDYGFFKTLLATIIATPIGIMNLISLKTLGI